MKYECHGHIILNGASYRDAVACHERGVSDAAICANLQAAANHGVRFFRDGGDSLGVSARAKTLAPEFGIDYRTPVFMLHMKGHYGSLFGKSFDDMRGYRALVLEAAGRGADFIKIAASGMLDLFGDGGATGPALTLPQLREMVNIARGEGFAVMAHVNGAENIKNALEAGVLSIEHGFWADREVARMLPDTNAVWVPTRVAVANHIGSGRFEDDVLRRILDAQAEALCDAFSRGAAIASGSDSGAAMVTHGQGTQQEYASLAALGINPERGNSMIAGVFRRGTQPAAF